MSFWWILTLVATHAAALAFGVGMGFSLGMGERRLFAVSVVASQKSEDV